MSTAVEHKPESSSDYTKPELSALPRDTATDSDKTQQHPLHQYDLTKMSKFYETCVSKLSEQNPKWKPSEWIKATPMPSHLSAEEQRKWANPVVISEKTRVYECFAKLARDLGEPMLLMPNFDISDLQNFELFLDSLKTDGVNAIRKFKQYLASKDMRKQEVDLVCVHARYGVILVECKDSDYVDYKRKSRAKMVVNQTKSMLKSLGRLIAESKGLAISEATVPVLEFVALPNVQERPPQPQSSIKPTTESSESPKPSTSRPLSYLIKSDLESSTKFIQWWNSCVVEPRLEQEKVAREQGKVNKFDATLLTELVALVNCIRSNSILPVVYPSDDTFTLEKREDEDKKKSEEEKKDDKEEEKLHFQPALNIHAEFFKPKHEQARALTKCVVLSKDAERVRKTVCLQALWLFLNDSQKKISIVCSDLNKPYYEEFFDRQRKVYQGVPHNVRFYTDLQVIGGDAVPAQPHTLKKDSEVWFLDGSVSTLSEVLERVKGLHSYWVFNSEHNAEQVLRDHSGRLSELSAHLVDLDEDKRSFATDDKCDSIKLPLRLQCDLLIVGDMISTNQLKFLYKFLQTKQVPSQAAYYPVNGQPQRDHHNRYQTHHMQQLQFNPAKKFRSVKFIRGGTIDTIRNSLKMHDSIQAQCVFMHVGDEDLFPKRNSVATIERVKELATLVKEYCPRSFCVLSTLMRRMSRTENAASNEVNKGIIQFCKQTRETLNCYYMNNMHFEPEYHIQGGRLLNNKGLKMYVDNILFVVDYFMIKNNKQH